MDLFTLLNTMMATAPTGTPQVPPGLPQVSSYQNSSTNDSDGTTTSNHKSDKEKERRALTNQRFEELHNLIKKDSNQKMSQAAILKAASTAAIEHKREFHSDHRSRGHYASLKKVEQVTIQYLKSLNLPHPDNISFLQNIEKLFEDFRDVILPVSSPIASPTNPSAPSISGASTNGNAEEARKEVKKNREQGRRDNLSDGYNALEKFLRENHLLNGTQKIQLLEATIHYLRHEPVTQLSQTDDAELEVGSIQGRNLGQNLALQYFKNHANFSAHYDTLRDFFTSQLGLLDSSTHMDKLQIDNTAIMNFKSIHPDIINFDDIITPAPAPVANNASVPEAVKRARFSIWRPYEEEE